MKAEILSIGDELTSGERLDTNTQWLSRRLGEIGVPVGFHTTVADDLDSLIDAFRAACARADVVLSTGGLGPTADDLTRQAIAAATGRELVLDREALEHIRSLFANRGRNMPERNRIQAMFPAGSQPIRNPHGTAPGIEMVVPRPGQADCRLFAFPGVPAELFEMWNEDTGPRLAQVLGTARTIRHYRLKCFGVGESDLEARLPDLIQRGRIPSVGITVHRATITLRITAPGESELACRQLMLPTIETIHRSLGHLVFGEEDEELQHVVLRLLGEKKKTLLTVEWGTAGLLSRWLADLYPAADLYLGGIVISQAAAAEALLQVPGELMRTAGMASEAVARALADRAAEQCTADYVLAVGPFPSMSPEGAAHRFHVALVTPERTYARAFPLAAHPDIVQSLAAKRALNYLRLMLIGQEE